MRGDVKRFVQDARQVLDRADKVIVLGAMAGDADRVAFLERVRADEMGGHLPRDADERDGIHQRIGEAGDRIGRAGAGGDEQDADLARRAGIALGGMGRALFMAHEHVVDEILLEDGVVDRQHGTARIPEDCFNALILQGLDDHFGPGHLLRHVSLRSALTRPKPKFPCLLRPSGNLGNKKGPQGGLGMRHRQDVRPVACPVYGAEDTISLARTRFLHLCWIIL